MDRKEAEVFALEGILARMKKYDLYFKSAEEVDHRAYSAYSSLVRVLMSVLKLSTTETRDPEEMRRMAREALVSEYGMSPQDDDTEREDG